MKSTLQRVTSAVGSAAFEGQGVVLYCGDCLDLIRRIPDGSIPLTVTSPPYNIGKEYEERKPVSEYLEWCTQWLREIWRITAPNGAFWLNIGYCEMPGKAKALPIAYMLWDRIPFYIVQEIVWNYGAGVAGRKFLSPRNEKFLWCVKDPNDYVFNLDCVRDKNVAYPNQRKNGKLKCNTIGKNPTDVWYFPKVTSGRNRASKERTPHPAQFPVAVVDRIVKACSDEGDVVLDPFMGSGSTAEACLMNKRKVIGFEIREDYVEIAAKRIRSFLRRDELARAQLELQLGI